MKSLADLITQYVPWLWPVAAWCLAALVLVALISLPAYLIFFPLLRNLRVALSGWLADLTARHASRRQARLARRDESLNELRTDSAVTVMSSSSRELKGAIARLRVDSDRLRKALVSVAAAPASITRAAAQINDAVSTPPPPIPRVPAALELNNQAAKIRLAWVRIAITTVLLLAIMSVNTGMLGEILKDLSIVPAELTFFGIHLYLVFAFILTLVEAGLGYAHTTSKAGPDEPERLPVMPLLIVLFACVIACVEGFFYSQVAPNKGELANLPFGIPVTQATLFFGWGAALVMALFTLGSIWSDSVETIARAKNYLPAVTAAVTKHTERISGAHQRTQQAAQATQSVLSDAVATVNTLTANATNAAKEVDATNRLLLDTAERTGETRNATLSDIRQLVLNAGLCACALAIAGYILFALSTYAFAQSYPSMVLGAGWAGAALVAVSAIIGLLFPRNSMFVGGNGPQRAILIGNQWWTPAVVVGALALLPVAAYGLRSRPAIYQIVVWLVVAALMAAVAAATSQTAALAGPIRLWFTGIFGAIITAAEFVARMLMYAFRGIVMVLDFLALLFAAPIFMLRQGKLPSLQLSPAESQTTVARAHGAS